MVTLSVFSPARKWRARGLAGAQALAGAKAHTV